MSLIFNLVARILEDVLYFEIISCFTSKIDVFFLKVLTFHSRKITFRFYFYILQDCKTNKYKIVN